MKSVRLFAAVLLAGMLLPFTWAAGKKNEVVLPTYVLQARTLAVVIDPDAGIDPNDPDANRRAQRAVEAAFSEWGRYRIAFIEDADLVVVIRHGNGTNGGITAQDHSQNRRPGYGQATDSGVLIGARSGPAQKLPAEPQAEVRSPDDSFAVYEGQHSNPDDRNYELMGKPPAWRITRKDVLKLSRAHTVPAVDAFKDKVAEAEAAAAQP